jgi:hypothetical protein
MKPMKRPFMTPEELHELGLTRELFNDWMDLMDAIWSKLISLYGKRKVRNSNENSILITHRGIRFEIACNFVNKQYIDATVSMDGDQRLEVRHHGDLQATTLCVSIFIHQFLNKL